MNKTILVMFKDFFYFTRGERGGIYVLCCLIVLMFSINFCLPTRNTEEEKMLSYVSNQKSDSVSSDTTDQHLYSDLSTTCQSSSIVTKQREHASSQPSVNNKPYADNYNKKAYSFSYDTVRVELNSADTTELKRLRGIGSVLSARIVKYRNKLGGFSSVEDLKNVYGLSDETYQSILPHVWIKK
ncbi:MAG: helix-hairpin-helix domain-containing protein [Paludibacteraceae bacterium]|nr:helix-hairpin-helix domain-containing protein [Paludibacteraceae bacterium]